MHMPLLSLTWMRVCEVWTLLIVHSYNCLCRFIFLFYIWVVSSTEYLLNIWAKFMVTLVCKCCYYVLTI